MVSESGTNGWRSMSTTIMQSLTFIIFTVWEKILFQVLLSRHLADLTLNITHTHIFHAVTKLKLIWINCCWWYWCPLPQEKNVCAWHGYLLKQIQRWMKGLTRFFSLFWKFNKSLINFVFCFRPTRFLKKKKTQPVELSDGMPDNQ